MNINDHVEAEIDILRLVEDGEKIPDAKAYRVRIDNETVRVETPEPTGELLLGKVHKRPCAFELIAEFAHSKSRVVAPTEVIDLRKEGLRGFKTVHKETVTIFINDNPYSIKRGKHTVAEILALVGQTSEGYILLEEKNGPPMPIPPNHPVHIEGCEIFFSQPQSGGSS